MLMKLNRSILALPLFTLLLFSFNSFARALPRRAFFGVRMENISDETVRLMKLPSANGVLVGGIIPGSTAESSELQRGDIWLAINGQAINSTQEGMAAIRGLREGQTVSYKYWRAGISYEKQIKMKALPKEQYADFDMEYGQVSANGALLRTLVSKPKKSGKRPAVLFLQGVGCYSIDSPMDTAGSTSQLLNYLTRQGFVTMRVDKPGQGDSQGTPCAELDFNAEADAYRQALLALRARPEVDADNIFIIGHSMGGVMAPLIAKDAPVKGIIAYGAIGVNFMEYLFNSRRTIAEANNMSPEEADDYVKKTCECSWPYFVEGKSMDDIFRELPDCRNYFGDLGRADVFWHQLYDLNIPALWSAYPGKVLAAWGQADYISTRPEHVLIAGYANHFHPGNGTFLEVPGADHGMYGATSFRDAQENTPKQYNPVVSQLLGKWLMENAGLAAVEQKQQPDTRMGEADPSPAREILKMDGVENAYPRWSKDGGSILFQSNRSGKWQLYRMDRDGSHEQQLTQGDANNNFPDWTADNRRIAFVSDRDGNEEIYLMNADGSGLKRLTNHPGRDIHPYLSPDGKKILFNSQMGGTENFEVYETDLAGSYFKRLTTTPDEETCARFSPDMQRIVFLDAAPGAENDDIFVMKADGTGRQNVSRSPGPEGWPAWSPDGSKIIYASAENGRQFSLYEINPDGSGRRQLSSPPPGYYDARPALNAAGEMVFNRQSGKTIGIYIVGI